MSQTKFSGYPDAPAHLLSYYAHEIYRQANSIKDKCETLFSRCPENGPETTNPLLFYYPEVTTLAWGILSEAASMSRMASSKNKWHKGENKKLAEEICQKRSDYISNIMKTCNVTEILDTKVRNTLDHFDEYFDQEVAEMATTREPRASKKISVDLGLSNYNFPDGKPRMIRTYVASEKTFYSFDSKIDIGRIYEEAKKIIDFMNKKYTTAALSGGVLIELCPTFTAENIHTTVEITDELETSVTQTKLNIFRMTNTN